VATEIGVGTQIGDYRVTGLIGRGGMGTVYIAEQVSTGRRVALKVLAPELTRSEDFRTRFIRESRYASSLHHPNIVRVHEVGEDAGALYMAMEYVQGSDLKSLLATEVVLEPAHAVAILAQIASALDAVHATGVLHRDVKPGNVIVARATGGGVEERAYLTDFGISKNPSQDSRPLTAAGDFVGTHYYTAPEQVLAKEIDSRADVYSLGCVLFECLTGAPPFARDRSSDVLRAHIEDPPPAATVARPGLPGAVDGIIARALAKDPADRYRTCVELMEAAGQAFGVAPRTDRVLELRVAGGRAVGAEIQVEEALEIGRDSAGAGRLAGDIELSRRHALIRRLADGSYSIEDLGSTNGTLVNDRRIEAATPLEPGDKVELGGTILLVDSAVRAAAQAGRPAASVLGAGPSAAFGARIGLLLEIDFGKSTATVQLDRTDPVRVGWLASRLGDRTKEAVE
jgi:serine/threonine-protein kinase